eukprot:3488340-Amphidinium_carterae.2
MPGLAAPVPGSPLQSHAWYDGQVSHLTIAAMGHSDTRLKLASHKFYASRVVFKDSQGNAALQRQL